MFRGVVLLLISVLSGNVALFVEILFSGKFDIIKFVVFSIGFITIMNEYAKRMKDGDIKDS